MKLLLATHNEHKATELRQLSKDAKLDIVTLRDLGSSIEIAEEEDTFAGNAMAKANFGFRNFGMPTLADDSGLVVPSIGGQPGIYSARFAGKQRSDADNMKKLLNLMSGIEDRTAYFVSMFAFCDRDNNELFEGRVYGQITSEPIGANGFGYDPIFIPEGYQRTFAQMSDGEKNTISHRYEAFSKFLSYFDSKENP